MQIYWRRGWEREGRERERDGRMGEGERKGGWERGDRERGREVGEGGERRVSYKHSSTYSCRVIQSLGMRL